MCESASAQTCMRRRGNLTLVTPHQSLIRKIMKLVKLPIAALVMALFAVPVLAQNTNTDRASPAAIEQRQAEQVQLISQGVASGHITEREATVLNSGQERIRRMEADAKADGRMSRTERTNITTEQNVQSKNIQIAMTNGEVRQSQTASVDARQARQQARIDKALAEGRITRQEADRLNRGQVRIARMETRAKADGNVTAAETEQLRTAQDQQSKAISQAT